MARERGRLITLLIEQLKNALGDLNLSEVVKPILKELFLDLIEMVLKSFSPAEVAEVQKLVEQVRAEQLQAESGDHSSHGTVIDNVGD